MDDLYSSYDQLNFEKNDLAANIDEKIPISISDNSTGSEENQFMNKKRIKIKDDINKNELKEQEQDIESSKSNKSIELYEEEKNDYSENKKNLKCNNKNKKNKKNILSNAISKNCSRDKQYLLNLEQNNVLNKCFITQKRKIDTKKEVSKFCENLSVKYENEKLKDEQNSKSILKNKENPQLLISLKGETNVHTGGVISQNHSKNMIQNRPESLKAKVEVQYLGDNVSENISGKRKKIEILEKKSGKFQEINEEKSELEEIKEQKQKQINDDSNQDEEDIEENYDDNYDPQNIFPNQSSELGNNGNIDELLNISLSNFNCNIEKYNCEINNDDNYDATKIIIYE